MNLILKLLHLKKALRSKAIEKTREKSLEKLTNEKSLTIQWVYRKKHISKSCWMKKGL